MIRAVLMLALATTACERVDDDPERAAPAVAPAAAALAWETDERAAFARARAERKDVLIDFRSEWCAPCKELDARTFSDPAVIAHVAPRYVPLKLDLTADGPAEQALMQRYGVDLLPTVMFASADGTERGRITEFVPPAGFLAAATSAEGRSAAPASPRPGR